MHIRHLISLLLVTISCLTADEPTSEPSSLVCFFTPPSEWEIAFPSSTTPHVKIIFTKPKTLGFRPSINLSIEPTSASLEEYLKIIKEIHEQDRNKEWGLLGKMQTQAGLAQLTQINTTSEFGAIRILQLILIKQGNAYILTAAALKKEFSLYYSLFHKALRSLTLSTDLIEALPLLEKRDQLRLSKETLLKAPEELSEKNPLFHSFAKEVHTYAQDLGAYWEYLLLQQTQEALLAKKEEAQHPIESSDLKEECL